MSSTPPRRDAPAVMFPPDSARLLMFHDDPDNGTGVVAEEFGPVVHFGGSLLAHLTHTPGTTDVLKEHVTFDPPTRYMFPDRFIYDLDGCYWVEGDAMTGPHDQPERLLNDGVPVVVRAEAFIGGVLHIYAQNGNLVYRITRFDHEHRCYIGEWPE